MLISRTLCCGSSLGTMLRPRFWPVAKATSCLLTSGEACLKRCAKRSAFEVVRPSGLRHQLVSVQRNVSPRSHFSLAIARSNSTGRAVDCSLTICSRGTTNNSASQLASCVIRPFSNARPTANTASGIASPKRSWRLSPQVVSRRNRCTRSLRAPMGSSAMTSRSMRPRLPL